MAKELGFFEIVEIANSIEAEIINRPHIEAKSELKIYVDAASFKKIDEDIYYRQFPDGKDFQPSDNMILINFEHTTISIIKKEEPSK